MKSERGALLWRLWESERFQSALYYATCLGYVVVPLMFEALWLQVVAFIGYGLCTMIVPGLVGLRAEQWRAQRAAQHNGT